MDMNEISNVVASCLILHNMFVGDRAMSGDVNELYNPEESLEEDITDAGSIQIPYDGRCFEKSPW